MLVWAHLQLLLTSFIFYKYLDFFKTSIKFTASTFGLDFISELSSFFF